MFFCEYCERNHDENGNYYSDLPPDSSPVTVAQCHECSKVQPFAPPGLAMLIAIVICAVFWGGLLWFVVGAGR
jgi:hypothetical protein